MRIKSTIESCNKGEISVLASIETLIAIFLSLVLAVNFGNINHIAISACVAPFLLLRSQESTNLAIRLFNTIASILKKWKAKDENPFRSIFIILILILSTIVIRIISILRFPIKGLQSIPENWKKVILCTDVIGCPPELIPGQGSIKQILDEFQLSRDTEDTRLISYFGVVFISLFFLIILGLLIKYIFPSTSEELNTAVLTNFLTQYISNIKIVKIVVGLIIIKFFIFLLALFILLFEGVMGILCYWVGYAYRLSLKSTAFLWAPLIYVINITYYKSLSTQGKIEEIRESSLWKLIRFFAWLTIFIIALKIILLPQIIEFWNNFKLSAIINIYLMPNKIHVWHIATFVNASIALMSYYFFIDKAPLYLREGIWTEMNVERKLKILTFVRGVISIYTITIGLYLTVKAAQFLKFPEWSGKIVPW